MTGLFTAIITPLDQSGRLSLNMLPSLLEFQRAAGIDGVVVCGTNGEGTSLSVSERMKTLDAVMENRGTLKVIAGTGATSITDALDLTRHAAEHGVDASLLLPPFFFKQPPVDGLAAYFLPILDEIDLPMLLYNIPQMTAVPISDSLLDRLEDHPRLAGIKDSAGDWTRTHEFISKYPRLKTFAGSEYAAAKCLRAGGAGCISGSSNAFPDLLVAVRDAFQSGDSAAIDAAQSRLEQMLNILVHYPFVGASKSVLTHRGFPRMGVRPTLVSLSPAQEAKMMGEFRGAGLL